MEDYIRTEEVWGTDLTVPPKSKWCFAHLKYAPLFLYTVYTHSQPLSPFFACGMIKLGQKNISFPSSQTLISAVSCLQLSTNTFMNRHWLHCPFQVNSEHTSSNWKTNKLKHKRIYVNQKEILTKTQKQWCVESDTEVLKMGLGYHYVIMSIGGCFEWAVNVTPESGWENMEEGPVTNVSVPVLISSSGSPPTW